MGAGAQHGPTEMERASTAEPALQRTQGGLEGNVERWAAGVMRGRGAGGGGGLHPAAAAEEFVVDGNGGHPRAPQGGAAGSPPWSP